MRPRRCTQGQPWAVAGHEGWSRGRRLERGGWIQSKRWSLELGTRLGGKRYGYSLRDDSFLVCSHPFLVWRWACAKA